MKRFFFNIIILFTCFAVSYASNPKNDSLNYKRFFTITGSEILIYGTSMTVLNSYWYKNYEKSPFHLFNDSKEWMQMDKAGHFFSSYYISSILNSGFNWSGLTKKKSAILGSAGSFVIMGTIEIFDGFSEKWGASLSDISANTLGCALNLFQNLKWNEQKIIPKFSFHTTIYPPLRPDALGRDIPEQIIKDYNGQTYWFSVNLHSITKSRHFPEWFCVSPGYSAEGMLSAKSSENYLYGDFKQSRQFFLSFDIDFSKIKTNSKTLKFIFKTINAIKVPFSAIEFSENKIHLHPIYF